MFRVLPATTLPLIHQGGSMSSTSTDPRATSGLLVKSLDEPDEIRPTADKGQIELVSLAGLTVGRATFQPGWRWSEHVKPHAGTALCQATHTGYVLSGRQHVLLADGTEVELKSGDAFVIPAGHDAWVIGEEPCVTLDFSGGAELARVLPR
jgi:quercetin dioxygenase-like cupin family protein